MKNYILITLLMGLFFGSKAQEVESSAYDLMLKGLLSHSVKEVSVKDIDTTKAFVFIDAREKAEYKVSHIKNAVFVGYDKLDFSPLDSIDKTKEIVVYCSVGYRSEKVSEKLIEKGFTNVSNLYGGIFEWKNQGKPVVNSKNETTEKVHAFSKVWGIWLKKGRKVY